jgi:hypothetical protein
MVEGIKRLVHRLTTPARRVQPEIVLTGDGFALARSGTTLCEVR